jgi:hypothetical protein
MKLKYALFEQNKNKFMRVLIFFQTVIVLIMLVSIISAIVSRYEKYKPLEIFFQGDGLNMHMTDLLGKNGQRYLPFTESSDVEKYLKKAHMVSSYHVQMTFDIDNKKEELGTWSPVIGYDDELISVYTPEMETGRWLRTEDADTDMIEIVLAQKEDIHKVGEIITLTTSDVIQDSRDCRLSEPVQAKVVGILADGASPIMRTTDYGEYSDFRDYYYPFNRAEAERAIVFVSKRDIEHNNKIHAATEQKNLIEGETCIWPYTISGPCFIQYDKGITQKEKDYNSKYLAVNGRYAFRYTSAEMRENSMEYIMNQMNMLIPVLIAMIILTLMSIISSTVIMIRQNMHNYSIYYMSGLTWRKCVSVHGLSVVIMQIGIFLFTMICIAICEKIGVLDRTVFSLGGWQLLGCLVVIMFFIVFSIALSFLLIGKKSVKDILREAE